MLRKLLPLLGLSFVATTGAQDDTSPHRNCGAHTITKHYLEQQGLSTDLLHALPTPGSVARGGIYSVPVVVHVVYNNTAENVPTGTINGLIAELNQDYSAANSDISGVRSSFTSSIGNVGFQFCLAQVDPNGNATTGITRTSTTETWFDPDLETNDMKSAPKGIAPWDTERYLNIWICDITSGAGGSTITVGYAYLPTGGVVGSNIDGLVIDYDYGTEIGARTATHEIGHYFGLMHTFDDDGACVNADGFSDTPTSNSPTYSCTNTNLMKCGALTQYENFMDYSNCTVMFTNQQANYMASILTGVRSQLLSNPACSPPSGSYCIPTSVNGTADGDYINRVALGTINNANSGGTSAPTYSNFTSTFSTTLNRTTQYTLTVQSGSYTADNYAAWIDYDQDNLFEATEKLGQVASTVANQTLTITFTVPAGATLGNTRLRVRGVFHDTGEPAPTDPCYNYSYGETEDYGITIANSGGAGPCIPTSANGTADGDFINAVVLEGIQNINSGGVDQPTYTDFSSVHNTSLARNSIYVVVIQGGSYEADNYAVWIDYDQDDLFETTEKLGEFATTAAGEAQVIAFTVPTTAALGATTMRVRGVYFDTGEPTLVDPCFSYAYGETEDYGISITPVLVGYCTPSSINGPADGDYIDGVVLGSINNTNSGALDGSSYTNYVSTYTANLERGSAQSIDVTGGEYAPDTYSVWIDYDQDQAFEANEKLGEFETADVNETGTINFVVPANATLGATRMRVRCVYFNDGEPTPADPCHPYLYGETEDYGIIIETTIGLDEEAQLTFGVRPNPAIGQVTLELPGNGASMIELIDLQGRIVLSERTAVDRVVLGLGEVAAGSYLVRISREGKSVTKRLEVLGRTN